MSRTNESQRTHAIELNPLMIGTREVARLLGLSVSTIKRYDELGKIPAPVWIGEAKRWYRKEIQSWAKAGCPDRDEWNARFPNRIPRPAPTPTPTKPAE